MGSVGVPQMIEEGSYYFPSPLLPAQTLLFEGSAVREEAEPGSPAWLHLGCKTSGGWSDRAVTLQGLLAGMRNSTLRKPQKPLQRSNSEHTELWGVGVFIQVGSQIPSWCGCGGERTQQQAGQGDAVTAELSSSSSSE